MKIIKPGNIEKTKWSKEYKCTGKGNSSRGCGATLLVEQEDLFLTHSYDYGGGHDVYVTFECPQCQCLTDIKDCPSGNLPNYEAWKKQKQKQNTPCDNHVACHCICHYSPGSVDHCFPCCSTCDKCGTSNIVN